MCIFPRGLILTTQSKSLLVMESDFRTCKNKSCRLSLVVCDQSRSKFGGAPGMFNTISN